MGQSFHLCNQALLELVQMFIMHKVQCQQVQTLVYALCWEVSLMCLGFGYMKKKKRRNSRGEGFILAWKSGINSNVSTLWSKEAPRKSSFWSTSQNWSWDLQNQLVLNEFARSVLEQLEQGVLRSGGSSSGTPPAAGLPRASREQKPKFCRAESLRHCWVALWGVADVLLWAHQVVGIPIHQRETKIPVLQVVGRSSSTNQWLISHWKIICSYLLANPATQLNGAILAEKAGEHSVEWEVLTDYC